MQYFKKPFYRKIHENVKKFPPKSHHPMSRATFLTIHFYGIITVLLGLQFCGYACSSLKNRGMSHLSLFFQNMALNECSMDVY